MKYINRSVKEIRFNLKNRQVQKTNVSHLDYPKYRVDQQYLRMKIKNGRKNNSTEYFVSFTICAINDFHDKIPGKPGIPLLPRSPRERKRIYQYTASVTYSFHNV